MSLNDWFAIDRHATPSMVGVPKAQRRQVESHYEGGIVAFAQNRGRRRPLQDFLATLELVEGWARLPYLPFRAPYYRFVGRRPAA